MPAWTIYVLVYLEEGFSYSSIISGQKLVREDEHHGSTALHVLRGESTIYPSRYGA